MKTKTTNEAKGHTLFQCMNTLQSPTRTKKHQLSPVKTSPPNNLPKRSKHRFSPITFPGTPDHQNDKVPCDAFSSGTEVDVSTTTYQKNNKEQDEDTDDELEDLFLYYKAFNSNPPDVDESNAESADRHQAIDHEYRCLKQQKKINTKNQGTSNLHHHTLSPFTQPEIKLRFQSMSGCSSPIFHPIIKPMNPSPNITETIQNNVQDITIQSDHLLYTNPERPLKPQTIDLIYDTGATISMMPAQYSYAWRNLRDCLHSLAGCFTGHTKSHLQIGEFHGIITLDSGETRRAIIPECIQIAPGLSNTYLLANTAFLMAGHQYISHLSGPKLKFSGKGTYTMSVEKDTKLSRYYQHSQHKTHHTKQSIFTMMSPTIRLPTSTTPSTNVPTDPMPTHRQHLPGILGMPANVHPSCNKHNNTLMDCKYDKAPSKTYLNCCRAQPALQAN
jgi:hypothetical protein